jgi:hypothetical protein
MIRLLLKLLVPLTLAACAGKPLPYAHGSWHQINADRWAYNANELTTPPAGLTP